MTVSLRILLGDTLFRIALLSIATLVLFVSVGIMSFLFKEGLPALQVFGPQFIISTDWNPVTDQYGAGVMLYGTLVTACIAVGLAVPFSLLIVFFLTAVAPSALVAPISLAVQLLAAVPSVVYGAWGFFVVAPVMASTVSPFMAETFGSWPILGSLFSGTPRGLSLLTASLVLSLMVLPSITAMVLRAIQAVPAMLKEASYSLGSTSYEVFFKILVPYARRAIVGAALLGLGRALGEAMAVSFVVGNATRISASLLAPGSTLAATIANEFHEAAVGSVKFHSLVELGFILFLISSLVLILSRVLVTYSEKQ